MGRGKLQLELIKKENARKNTFEKREKGLLKKMYEFATLCDVDACMIIYNTTNSPNTNHLPAEIWPPHSPSSVLTMARRFKSLSLDDRSRRTVNLSSFYNERMKKVVSEVTKLRSSSSTTTSSTSSSARFQSWDPSLENLSYEEMAKADSNIDSKLQQVKLRLALLKTHTHHQQQQQLLQHQQQHHPQQQLQQFQLEQLQQNQQNSFNYMNNYVREAAPLNVHFPEPLLPGAMVVPSQATAVMDVVNENFSLSYSRFPWLLFSNFSSSPPPP